MSRGFDVVIERDSEGYYVASVPALPGCHTQARSLDELSARIKEAIELHLEVERSYDDESELTRYIWNNYEHLMTDLERRVGRAILGRQKAAAVEGEAMKRMLSKRWGLAGDPEVDSALSAGPEPFRRPVARRILLECDDAIVNRCPQCRRVVRTPRARQCLWCGHDWHSADPSPEPMTTSASPERPPE